MTTDASKSLLDRSRQVVPGGVHSNVRLSARPHPLFFARAEGAYLWDVDGNRYIDFVLGQGPMFLGHCHPAVTDRVAATLRTGQLYAGQHRDEVGLSEALCETIPCAERVRFTSSGSEAVQAALRLGRAATGRRRVVKFEGHYHGWIDSIFASVAPERLPPDGSREPSGESDGQLVPRQSEVTVVPWNDRDAVLAELRKGDVALVILEPVAANHSVILPEPGFLELLRRECDATGAALVFDEIITGFRLGLGGAQARLGVTPDLAIFGKAMASGFPIACVAGREVFFDGVAEGRVVHAGTFNGNAACVAAALATVETLRNDPSVYENARGVGAEMISRLENSGVEGLLVQGLPELFWTGFGTRPILSARDLLSSDSARMLDAAGELAAAGVYVTSRGTWYLSGVHSSEDGWRAVDAFLASANRTATDAVGDSV